MRSGCVYTLKRRAAQEADDRLAEALGRRDRQARRRRHRAQHRDPRDRRLLHELERQPARHEQDLSPASGSSPFEQRVADQLVERVVPADVFARGEQRRRRRVKRAAACSPPVWSNTR